MFEKKRLTIPLVAAGLVMIAPLFFHLVSSATGTAPTMPYNLYFGDLHAHTTYSDAWEGTPEDAFAAAKAAGADFMALTDHHFSLSPEEWAQTLQVADQYTSADFVAIAGYEFWLPDLGEINVFNVVDIPSPHPGLHGPDRKLPHHQVPGAFYDWLADQPGGVGLWVHPTDYSRNFDHFAHRTETRDQGIGLLEIHNYGSWTMPYALLDYEASYIMALDQGWHVMPAANSDTHSPDWISGYDVRTVLLAPGLTHADLYEAMSASRGYATLDKNLRIYYTLNGAIMGSDLDSPAPTYDAWVRVEDPDGDASDAITLVEIVSDGGTVVASRPANATTVDWTVTLPGGDAHYFYVRVTTASNVSGGEGVTAWTAPVWTGR